MVTGLHKVPHFLIVTISFVKKLRLGMSKDADNNGNDDDDGDNGDDHTMMMTMMML